MLAFLAAAALGPPEITPGLTTRTIVLTYHDMVPKRTKDSLWFDCTPDELKDQTRWLRSRGAKFISLDDLYLWLTQHKSIPKQAVAVTFADNYEGFYTYAWPILQKQQIPVTMFVHTGFVGNQSGRPKMTWEQLQRLSNSNLFRAASQTVTHPERLDLLGPDDLSAELKVSQKDLLDHLPHSSSSFLAYPNGKFIPGTAAAAKAAGYWMAFTEEQRPAETAKSIFLVPRYVHTKWREAWEALNPADAPK